MSGRRSAFDLRRTASRCAPVPAGGSALPSLLAGSSCAVARGEGGRPRPGDEILVPAYHHGSEIEALVRAGLTAGSTGDPRRSPPTRTNSTRSWEGIPARFFSFTTSASHKMQPAGGSGVTSVGSSRGGRGAGLARHDGRRASRLLRRGCRLLPVQDVRAARRCRARRTGPLRRESAPGHARARVARPAASGLDSLKGPSRGNGAGRVAPPADPPCPGVRAGDPASGRRGRRSRLSGASPAMTRPFVGGRTTSGCETPRRARPRSVPGASERCVAFRVPGGDGRQAQVLGSLAAAGIHAFDFWSIPHPSLPMDEFPWRRRCGARSSASQ